MSYTHIVALLDTQIDLLRQARRLLTTPEPLIPKPRRTKNKDSEAASADQPTAQLPEQGSEGSLPAPTMPGATATAPVSVQPARAQRKRQARSVKPPVAELTALSGSAPAGPVFVPAGQVRSLEARREESRSAAQNVLSSGSVATLTAEVLARSWLIDPRLSEAKG